MSSDKDSPSWHIYKSYWEKKSKGLKPKHLYDGYQGPALTVEGLGPFATNPPNDKTRHDVSSVKTELPPDLKIVSPIQANVDRVKDSLKQKVLDNELEERKHALLPPEGIVHNLKGNPYIEPSKISNEAVKFPKRTQILGKRKVYLCLKSVNSLYSHHHGRKK